MNCGLNDRDASLPDANGGQALTIKTLVVSGFISLALTGCGTVATVFQDDADAARELRRQKTYCQSIPRVYSGLAYYFCMLNAPPEPAGMFVSFVLMDLLLSGALDTVALPYTIYRQGMDGNIRIYWRPAPG
ncbi:YceK/YidQ family lipoprotein|nr:YceK/YidQ family lipoprotein [Pseudomonas sp. SbOxS1]